MAEVARKLERMTPAEFRLFDGANDFPSEYIDGIVYLKLGATEAHARVCMNLGASLVHLLSGSPCEPFGGQLAIRGADEKFYACPDAMIVCGERRYEDSKKKRTLLNPVVLFEVLSESTYDYCLGRKLHKYRDMPSIRHVVFIHFDVLCVELHTRQDEDHWQIRIFRNLEQSLELAEPAISIPLREIYRGVRFTPPEETEDVAN